MNPDIILDMLKFNAYNDIMSFKFASHQFKRIVENVEHLLPRFKIDWFDLSHCYLILQDSDIKIPDPRGIRLKIGEGLFYKTPSQIKDENWPWKSVFIEKFRISFDPARWLGNM